MTTPPRRTTRQRRIILEELKKLDSHPNAQTLFRLVKKRLPSIGFATVYRNLKVLRDEGLILELELDRQGRRYDGTTKNHYHLVCLCCGRVVDLGVPVSAKLGPRISRSMGLRIVYHRVQFYGYCKDCKNMQGGRNGRRKAR